LAPSVFALSGAEVLVGPVSLCIIWGGGLGWPRQSLHYLGRWSWLAPSVFALSGALVLVAASVCVRGCLPLRVRRRKRPALARARRAPAGGGRPRQPAVHRRRPRANGGDPPLSAQPVRRRAPPRSRGRLHPSLRSVPVLVAGTGMLGGRGAPGLQQWPRHGGQLRLLRHVLLRPGGL